jgi:hypothetical protein
LRTNKTVTTTAGNAVYERPAARGVGIQRAIFLERNGIPLKLKFARLYSGLLM